MIFRGLSHGAGGVLLAGLLVSVAVAGPRMDVEVAVDDLEFGELYVTMQLSGFADGPLRLRGVPAWIDNPLAEAHGEVVRRLRVHDQHGQEVTAHFSRDESGEPGWTIDASGDLEISYQLVVDFSTGEMVESYPILVPFMDDHRAWLLGNHVFLTPEVGTGRVDHLLRELPVDLHFDLPGSIGLVGPPREVRLRNLFELLSLQFGVGDFEVMDAPVDGLDARVVAFDLSEFSKAERDRLCEAMGDLAGRALRLFGDAPTGSMGMLAYRSDGIGGLEGAWAFHAYAKETINLADTRSKSAGAFFSVVAHELVHSWLPVALFPRDDPWVKEGFTSWYGYALAARGGWIGPAAVDRIFADYEEMVFGDVELEAVPLSDPRLWFEEYSGENWRRVTYERGLAVTLLLDVLLRGETDNRRSLDDVLPLLFERHAHSGFGREALLSAIEDATGVDGRDFFAEWVDGTDPPPARVVDKAMREAVKYGAFATD